MRLIGTLCVIYQDILVMPYTLKIILMSQNAISTPLFMLRHLRYYAAAAPDPDPWLSLP